MLNLFNLLPKKYNKAKQSNKNNNKNYKHFPSSIREWKNSIYVYNKNSEKLIPSISEFSLKLIKSYFNLYNKRLELKMRTKGLLLRLRKLSSNKFFVSGAGFKHTNNKVLINLYVFNRQKSNYLLTLKKWFLSYLLTKTVNRNTMYKNKKSHSRQKWTIWSIWKKRYDSVESKNRKIRGVNRKRININKKIIRRIREINSKSIKTLETLNDKQNVMMKLLDIIKKNNKYNIKNFKSFDKYTEDFHKNLIKKSLRKVRMYFYYKQLILLNKSKLDYTFLQHVKKHLESIFNKNVEFNIINLKRFYLNSDILSESIANKLAVNRRKMMKYLAKLKDKVNVKKKISMILSKPKQNISTRLELSNNNFNLSKYIMNSLKYKYVTGFRIEAKGRLSKRFTASRSLSKLKYKGNLLELDSSNRGWSSVLLKGNLKSNTQYTKIKSKSRLGSFGIKGWVSGN